MIQEKNNCWGGGGSVGLPNRIVLLYYFVRGFIVLLN